MNNTKRYHNLASIYGSDIIETLFKSKVLLVGCGGIGVEVLKHLTLNGFGEITVVDLDTIELSNLNRQYLFDSSNIGQSKAIVATNKISASFVKDFTLVINALDNIKARKHVNRITRSANVPLIDAGTAGFLGQITPFIEGKQCFECTPHFNTTKTYPICTIRSLPEKDIHCVVWSLNVFNKVFKGEGDIIDMNFDMSFQDFEIRLFRCLFEEDILNQLKMREVWPIIPPDPIYASSLKTLSIDFDSVDDTDIVSDEILYNLFLLSSERLYKRFIISGESSYEKDDIDVLNFIYSAASLRMSSYHIQKISRFKIKGMSRSIVHAVVSTNSIAAADILIQTIKILLEQYDLLKNVNIAYSGPRYLSGTKLEDPNSYCPVCFHSSLSIQINTSKTTLRSFYTILIDNFDFHEPYIDVVNRESSPGTLEDSEDIVNLFLNASAIKINNDAIVVVQDEISAFKIEITVYHDDSLNENDFHIIEDSKKRKGELDEKERNKKQKTV